MTKKKRITKAEKEVYTKTLEMYDYKCALCGSPVIQCHHIRYGSLRGGRLTYFGNVIPLCKKHHDLVHTNKDKYMPMLIEMINKKIEEVNYE